MIAAVAVPAALPTTDVVISILRSDLKIEALGARMEVKLKHSAIGWTQKSMLRWTASVPIFAAT